MNWWSAFTWCESIGGRLASFNELCPSNQMLVNETTGACPNLTAASDVNSLWLWHTAKAPDDTTRVYRVNPKTGAIRSNPVDKTSDSKGKTYAACSE